MLAFLPLLGALLAPQESPADFEVEFDEAVVEVPMDFHRHLPAVEVMVNGRGPYRFALDTGASGVARADVTLVQELELPRMGSVQVSPMRSLDVVELESIRIGGVEFRGSLPAPSRDYNHQGLVAQQPVAGVLGFHLFADCLLTLDYPGRTLRIEQGALPEPDGATILALVDSPSSVPAIRLDLDGEEREVLLDAGKPMGLQIPAAWADHLATVGDPVPAGQGRSVHGSLTLERIRLDGFFALGQYEFVNPQLDLVAPEGPALLTDRAVLGAGILRQFRLTFDQRHGRLELRPGQRGPLRDGF